MMDTVIGLLVVVIFVGGLFYFNSKRKSAPKDKGGNGAGSGKYDQSSEV